MFAVSVDVQYNFIEIHFSALPATCIFHVSIIFFIIAFYSLLCESEGWHFESMTNAGGRTQESHRIEIVVY